MAVRLVSLVAKLGMDGSGFQQTLSRAGGQMQRFTGSIKAQLAGAFGTVALAAQARAIVQTGSDIADLAKKLRLSTTDTQALTYALKQSGADASDLQANFKALSKARDAALSGDRDKQAAFSDLGIDQATLQAGNLVEIFKTIGDTIRKTDFGGDESALLEKVLGRGAMELLPAFKEGMRELADEAERVGAIMGPEVVAKLDEAGDKVSQLAMRFKAALAPAVVFVADAVKGIFNFLDQSVGSLGAFIGGYTGTEGSVMEKAKAGLEAGRAHSAESIARARLEASPKAAAVEPERKPGTVTRTGAIEEAAKVLALRERLAELQRKAMSDEDRQLSLLQKKRAIEAELVKLKAEKAPEAAILQKQIDLQATENELRAISERKPTSETRSAVSQDFQKSSFEEVGAFGGMSGGQAFAIRAFSDDMKRTANNTEAMKKSLEVIARPGRPSGAGDSIFG